MNKTSKRILAVGLPLVVVAATGVGYAYWTGGGSGTGSAKTAAETTALLVEQVAAPTNLAPGIAAGAISVKVTNPSTAASSVQVNKVVATFTVTPVGSAVCDASNYELLNATMTDAAGELARGGTATFTGATLGFVNSAANQDGCKGATVNLSYTAS